MTIRKGVIETTLDTGKMQTVSVSGLAGESHDGVEVYQQFGFTSSQPDIETDGKGAECIIVNASGVSVVIAIDDRRHRPTDMPKGSSGLYSSNPNQRVTLDPETGIKLRNGAFYFELLNDGTLNINAATVNITSDVSFTGNLTSNGKNISDTHTHKNVQAGSGNSGGVN